MSVQAVQVSQQLAQARAVSQVQSSQKQAASSAVPQDRVTISAAAQAKQTAAAVRADGDHDGK
jgi:hypothetical protein